MQSKTTGSSVYAFADFELDPARLELRRASQPVHLNQVQMRLLGVLVQSADRVVSKQELLQRVWDGRAVSDNVITVAMARLRKVLETPGQRALISSIHGVGYRFVAPVAVCVPAPQRRALLEPFVGREQLLSHLHAALAAARSGMGGSVMLMGDAGIGKTRAAEELARASRTLGVVAAWGRCREFGDTPPLWPFSELLRELIAQQQLDLNSPQLASALPYLARLLPEFVGSAGSVADRGSALPRKHLVFDAVLRVLGAVAEAKPCLLVLDDLHRADPASLELLAFMLDDLPRLRLLVVGALRGTRAADNELLARVLGHRAVMRIALAPLCEQEVGAYLDAAVGGVSADTRRRVFGLSDGNPFFMTEMARQLRMRSQDVVPVLPPEAALDVLRQRIAALRPCAQAHLAAAAVLGRSFGLAQLLRVTGLDFPALSASLDEGVAGEIVLLRPGSRTEFSFSHELLRSVLYDTLEPAQRRELHLRVVQTLEERRLFEHAPPADLAYHARAALPLGDLRKTVSYCMTASEAAANVFAYADAARHLREARETLELLPNASPRLRLRLSLQEALLTRAQSTRAFVPLIARVLSLAQALGDGDTLARAAMLHDPYPGLPALPGAVSAFETALAVLQSSATPQPLTAAMMARLALSPPLAFDATACSAQLDRAEQLAAASGELLDEYSVRVARLFSSGGPLHPDPSAAVAQLAALYDRHAQVLSVPPLMLELQRAVRALQDGELAVMQAALERAAARSRKLDSELLWHFERYLLIARLNAGQSPEARAALQAWHERARGQAISGTELLCAYDELIVLDVAGAREQARDSFRAADQDRPNMWALKLRALAAAGELELARAALHQVPAERLAALPCDRDYLGTLGMLAHAVVALQELDYAAELYALLRPYGRQFSASFGLVCEGSIGGLLGELALALGLHGRARTHLRSARELSRSVGLEPCALHAQAQLARLERA